MSTVLTPKSSLFALVKAGYEFSRVTASGTWMVSRFGSVLMLRYRSFDGPYSSEEFPLTFAGLSSAFEKMGSSF